MSNDMVNVCARLGNYLWSAAAAKRNIPALFEAHEQARVVAHEALVAFCEADHRAREECRAKFDSLSAEEKTSAWGAVQEFLEPLKAAMLETAEAKSRTGLVLSAAYRSARYDLQMRETPYLPEEDELLQMGKVALRRMAIAAGVVNKSYVTVRYGAIASYTGEATITLPTGDIVHCVGREVRGNAEWISREGGIEYTVVAAAASVAA